MNDQLMRDAQYAKWFANRNPNVGMIFFVDGVAGDDNNPGNKPECPLLKIDTALATCTSDKDDYIFVLDSWSAEEPVTIDKSKVHIIGVNNPQAPWCALNAGGDTNIFELSSSANHCEIAGFNFGGGNTKGGILTQNAIGLWIHHCAFGHQYASDTPAYGIYNGGTYNTAFALIEDCWFFGNGNNAGGTLTIDGILMTAGYPTFVNSIIRRNVFMGLPGVAINLQGVQGAMVLGNKMALDANTAGAGITLGAACLGCWIDENVANYGDTAMGNNPFTDGAAAGANSWGLNYKGGASIMPA